MNTQKIILLAPIKNRIYRLLWIGMGFAYTGDRIQELAMGWLVANITDSASAVGTMRILYAAPMFLMPLSGTIADQLDRKKLLLYFQMAGTFVAGIVATLSVTNQIRPWQIYVWALASGFIWLFIRPVYKTLLTLSVPDTQIRSAVSINSITESVIAAVVQAGGSTLIYNTSLSVAFIINFLSHLISVFFLKPLVETSQQIQQTAKKLKINKLIHEFVKGIQYLINEKALFYPLLITFIGNILIGPIAMLLPAIVHSEEGTIINLGVLGTAQCVGALLGAIFAGIVKLKHPITAYSILGIFASLLITLFVFNPTNFAGAIAQCGLGFLAFSQAVWNTSRVPLFAKNEYQVRIQAFSSMVFTLGGPLGAFWGGIAFDHFGINCFLISGITTGIVCSFLLIWRLIKQNKPVVGEG